MNSIFNDLTDHIKALDSRGRLLLARGDEELNFLRQWLVLKNDPPAEPAKPVPGNALDDVVKGCVKCGPVENKKTGFGSGKSRIMIILNTPHSVSRVDIERLRDESKELLTKMLAAISIDIKDCYTTNLTKCDPGRSSNTPGQMLKNCEYILKREIQEYNPQYVIVMGDDILIKRMINDKNDIILFKLEHPVILIKNPHLKKNAWFTLQDIEKVRKNNS